MLLRPTELRGLSLALLTALICAAPLHAASPAYPTTAPIVYLTDLSSGRTLLAKAERRRFVPASLTKIMTSFVAFEMLKAGTLQPNQRIAVSDAAISRWSGVGSSMGLTKGASVTVDELLMAIMTVSANDGSIVLAEGASGSVEKFVALMNAQARALGMNDSHFGRPNGWPDEGATYTSAADLTKLASAMISRHPALYHRYVGHKRMVYNGVEQVNHVPILGVVEGADGIKTGFTNESGYGFVGSAVRGGRRLVLVVGGFPNSRERARESRDLLDWGFAAWQSRTLFRQGDRVASARIQNGADRSVDLVTPRIYGQTFAPGEARQPRLTLRYFGPLLAPISQGDELGELIVSQSGSPPSRLPLVAAHSVAEAGFWQRLRNGLLGFLGL